MNRSSIDHTGYTVVADSVRGLLTGKEQRYIYKESSNESIKYEKQDKNDKKKEKQNKNKNKRIVRVQRGAGNRYIKEMRSAYAPAPDPMPPPDCNYFA